MHRVSNDLLPSCGHSEAHYKHLHIVNNIMISASIDLIWSHKKWVNYTRSSTKMIRNGIGIWTKKILFTIERYDKICHQSTPRRQTCVMVKTWVMTSHERHSEPGSDVHDCLAL